MKNKTIRDEIGRFTTRKVSFVDKYILNNRNLSVLLLSYIITLIFVYMTETTTVHAEIPPCPAEACEIIYEKLDDVVLKSDITIEKKAEEVNAYCHPSKNPEVNRLINKYFTDCVEARTIWAIAQSESAGKQHAINKKNRNGSWDCGYVQANTIHRNKGETYQQFCDRMHDLEENIKMAKHVKDVQGWTAWVQYNNGQYLPFMK